MSTRQFSARTTSSGRNDGRVGRWVVTACALVACTRGRTERATDGGSPPSETSSKPSAGAAADENRKTKTFDAVESARVVCESAPGSAPRKDALDGFARYIVGTRAFSLADAQLDRGRCVSALLPSAIAINLWTGIPAGVSLGMAIQETGDCAGRLVEVNNFHGQKANLARSGFSHWNGERFETESSENADAGGPKVRSAFMRLSHVDYSFEAMAERLVHPDVAGHRYEPCLTLRSRAPAFARCIGRIWSVHDEYAERVLRHRETWDLARCELLPSEWRLVPKFAVR